MVSQILKDRPFGSALHSTGTHAHLKIFLVVDSSSTTPAATARQREKKKKMNAFTSCNVFFLLFRFQS